MANPTEIYWPAGWSRERLVHADLMEIIELPQDEINRMNASLRAVLGPDGFAELNEEMSQNYKDRLAAEDNAAATATASDGNTGTATGLSPEMLVPTNSALRMLGLAEQGEWGWIAFKTASTGSTPAEEAEFQRRFDAEIAQRFDDHAALGVTGIREVQARFRIVWITDPELIGASEADVARRYREMLGQDWQGVPTGMSHSACLLLNESCVRSVLEAPAIQPKTRDKQRVIPYLRAVGAYMGAEEAGSLPDGERLSFNVAVGSLIDEFFIVIGGGVQDVGEVGAGVGEGQVWCSSGGRHGVFTPS